MYKAYNFWALFNHFLQLFFHPISTKIMFSLLSAIECILLVDLLTLQSLKDTNIFSIFDTKLTQLRVFYVVLSKKSSKHVKLKRLYLMKKEKAQINLNYCMIDLEANLLKFLSGRLFLLNLLNLLIMMFFIFCYDIEIYETKLQSVKATPQWRLQLTYNLVV